MFIISLCAILLHCPLIGQSLSASRYPFSTEADPYNIHSRSILLHPPHDVPQNTHMSICIDHYPLPMPKPQAIECQGSQCSCCRRVFECGNRSGADRQESVQIDDESRYRRTRFS